jgi:Na+-driven multidrug efflux pump
MVTTLLTVGVNLILAPLFIFAFHWGIRGAAMATVFAQCVGMVWAFSHFGNKKHTVHFLPGYFKLRMHIVTDIFSIGMSNFLMLTCASLIVVILNLRLKKYGGDFAIGAFGIINSVANLIAMTILGFNQGMQPIAGYNFGARQFPRVLAVFRRTLAAGTCVALFGFGVGELFPKQIAAAFTSNDELINLAATGMRFNLMMFPVVGFQMVTSNFFQAIGNAKISIFLSLARQVLFLTPALLILPHFFGLNGVWCASPVSDFTASVVTVLVLRSQLTRMKQIEH